MDGVRRMKQSAARSGPAVGAPFVGFVVALGAAAALAVYDLQAQPLGSDASAAGNLGIVAATVFAITGLLCLHRFFSATGRALAILAIGFLFPSAAWSTMVFVAEVPIPGFLGVMMVLATATLSVVCLVHGFRHGRWLEAFCGLGCVGLSLGFAIGGANGESTGQSAGLAFLVALAAMTCLYGTLVEIEVVEYRTQTELADTKERLAIGERRTEDLLHDLRSGLLSIEAAVAMASGGADGLLRAELTRLRLLTRAEPAPAVEFDLVPQVRSLVGLHQAAGATIDLRAPDQATLVGSEGEVMSIVQNLIDNAERHGEGPITLRIDECENGLSVSVADCGGGVPPDQRAAIFDRGITSHPHGSGIGLDVARRLAEANGADLFYEADPDCLSTFVLSFKQGPDSLPALEV